MVTNISGNGLQFLPKPLMPLETLLLKAQQLQIGTGPFITLELALYKASFRPTPLSTKDDLLANEVAYDGYSRVDAGHLMNVLRLGGTGYQNVSDVLAYFAYGTPSVPPVGDVAGGAFLLSVLTTHFPPPTELKLVFPFDAPVVFSLPYAGLTMPTYQNVVD